MTQIGDSYPLQITATWNSYDITIDVPGPKDGDGNRTVDISWTGPTSGSITDFVITPRLLDETSVQSALRHFGPVIT